MAIDVINSELIPLQDVPALLNIHGRKPLAATTIWRWAQKGAHGKKLATIRVGNTICTTREALQEFCEESPIQAPRPHKRRSRVGHAERLAEQAGI